MHRTLSLGKFRNFIRISTFQRRFRTDLTGHLVSSPPAVAWRPHFPSPERFRPTPAGGPPWRPREFPGPGIRPFPGLRQAEMGRNGPKWAEIGRNGPREGAPVWAPNQTEPGVNRPWGSYWGSFRTPPPKLSEPSLLPKSRLPLSQKQTEPGS